MGLFREIKFELTYLIFAGGVFMTALAMLRYFFDSQTPQFLRDINSSLGEWIIYVAFFGPLLALGGGWYFVDMIRKRREFERLLATPSKAAFVRNQDRVEYLAWYLTKNHERRVEDKKREFKIRT